MPRSVRDAVIYVSNVAHSEAEIIIKEMREIAESDNYDVCDVIVEKSGCDESRKKGFNRLRRGVNRQEFATVMAWSIDHLGGSIQEFIGFVGELHKSETDLYIHRQGLDTTREGKPLFEVCATLSEFERARPRRSVRRKRRGGSGR